MEAINVAVYNSEGKEVQQLKLNASVFDGTINDAAIYQTVTAFTANQRKGFASTKTMGEVSGGGKKPWRQKGTGRARQGSTRSPLWRHGGVVFGPHPRDFSYTLPQKIRNLALKSALNAKLKESNLIVLDNFPKDILKTKEAVKVFKNLKLTPAKGIRNNSVLMLLDKVEASVKRCVDNISFVQINRAQDTHTYEVITHKKLLVTAAGLEVLINRLKG